MSMDMEQVIRETILDEIYRACDAANMPQGFVDAIKLTKVSEIRYEITNDYGYTDKYGEHAVAKYLEFGTRDHWIEPVFAKALAFPSGGPTAGRPQAIYSKQHGVQKGDVKFSKGHYVRGIRELAPMRRGFEAGLVRLQEVLGG